MAKVKFIKDFPAIEIDKNQTLMAGLLAAGHPVASSCLGDGICGKCRVNICEGLENLSAPTELESRLKDRLHIPSGVRISCQCRVLGDVTVDTNYW